MDNITSILSENWIYIVGAVVLFWGNITDYVNKYLSNLKSELDKVPTNITPSPPPSPAPTPLPNIVDNTSVSKDMTAFEWIKLRAINAGDKSLVEEINNVHKNFIIIVYTSMFNSSDGAKQQ